MTLAVYLIYYFIPPHDNIMTMHYSLLSLIPCFPSHWFWWIASFKQSHSYAIFLPFLISVLYKSLWYFLEPNPDWPFFFQNLALDLFWYLLAVHWSFGLHLINNIIFGCTRTDSRRVNTYAVILSVIFSCKSFWKLYGFSSWLHYYEFLCSCIIIPIKVYLSHFRISFCLLNNIFPNCITVGFAVSVYGEGEQRWPREKKCRCVGVIFLGHRQWIFKRFTFLWIIQFTQL